MSTLNVSSCSYYYGRNLVALSRPRTAPAKFRMPLRVPSVLSTIEILSVCSGLADTKPKKPWSGTSYFSKHSFLAYNQSTFAVVDVAVEAVIGSDGIVALIDCRHLNKLHFQP